VIVSADDCRGRCEPYPERTNRTGHWRCLRIGALSLADNCTHAAASDYLATV